MRWNKRGTGATGSHERGLVRFAPAAASLLFVLVLSSFCAPARGQANVQGQWTTLPTQMPINPIHITLMHNGKVLIVSGSGNLPSDTNFMAAIWDPVADSVTTMPLQYDMFCNGMIELPDGRAIVISGTLQYDPFHGDPRTSVYSLTTGAFTEIQSMAHGRWYPTATTLSDGSLMVFSGLDENGSTNTTVEIYNVSSGWSQPYQAGWTPPLYPRMFLLPNGKVFYSGPSTSSAIFDPIAHTWQTGVATTNYSGTRTYGSSVMLPLLPSNNYKPVIIIMGGGTGGGGSTNTTELIDLSASTPKWVFGPSMSESRIEMDAVMLPNGKILAVNGSGTDEDGSTASLNADMYDPVANSFSSAGANAFARLYHSGALLLPDATVLVIGGNPERGTYEPHLEIYSPPYLFNSNGTAATRPSITSVTPGVIGYGAAFQVQTPNAANISSAVLVRPGSPTHAFDMDQRLVGLNFTAGSGVLNVTSPPNSSIAPPGYYMLFLLNSAGVPSLAQFIQLSLEPNDQPPTGTILAPPGNVTIGPGQIVSFSGTGTSPSGTIASYSWVFPGGTPPTSNLANPGTVTYSTPGTYPASLTVTDNLGVTDPNPPTVAVTVASDFAVSAASSGSIVPGGTAQVSVGVNSVGQFSGTVALSVSGLPTGVTASFNPTSTTAPGSSILTLTASSSTALGTYTVTVTGMGPSTTHSTTFTLNVVSSLPSANAIAVDFVGLGTPMGSTEVAGVVAVNNWNDANGAMSSSPLGLVDDTGASTNATVTWTSDNTWDQPITDQPGNVRMMKGYLDNGNQHNSVVTVSGLPSNSNGFTVYVYAQGSSSNTTNTGIYQISGAGITTNSVSLTYNSNFNGTFIQATASNPVGNYVVFTLPNVLGFTLTAIPSTSSSGYERAPINGIEIVPIAPMNPNFGISATPATNTIGLNSSITYTVTASAIAGFNGTITLSASGLPSQATPSFSPPTLTGSGTSTLTITTSSGTPVGSSTVTVTGTSGSLTHSSNVTLNVASPDFTISANPATSSVTPGGTATYTVTTQALYGFTDTVALSIGGLPSGAMATFNPTAISGSGSSTLTVTTSTSTPAGNGTLTITGTATEGLSHSVNVTMNVTAPDFALAVSPSSVSIISGGTASYTTTVTPMNGFAGSVGLSITAGLPSGASYTFSPSSVPGSGNSSLSITTSNSTPTGSYTLTISGTSGGLTHTVTTTLSVTSSSSTNVVSIDFVGLGNPMGASEVAGVVPKANWNDANGASNSTPLALMDETGAATTATVTWRADDSWDEPITDQPGNVRMMKGYLDNGSQNTTTIQIANLPPDPNGYSVYVYADGSTSGSNTGIYQISGTGITTVGATLTYTSNFSGTFTQATTSNPVGNYVILTIPATSAFTLSAIPSTSSSGYQRAPVNGIQIVPLGPPNPDFTIGLSPSSQTVTAGNSTTYTVTTTALNGFSGTVSLAPSGLPSGATPSFSPASIAAGGTSTLTVTTTSGETASSGSFNVTGTSGTLSHSASATLNVTAPDFSISATPSTTQVAPGGSATYTVTIGALNGFTGAVNLAVSSGLPSGATPGFVPTSITTSGSSILTITTTAGTPTGIATLTITGTGPATTHSTTVTLNVTSSTSSASAISIDFEGLDTTPMASSEVAGVVPLSNWNEAAGASSSSPLALVDQNGNPTTATVVWTSDDVWNSSSVPDQAGNDRMMRGYLDDAQMDTTTVTVSGLPPSANGYSVYVYVEDLGTATKTGIYQISGPGITTTSTILQFEPTTSFNGTFTQATSSNPVGNYVVLTIPNVSGFTVSATPNTSTIAAHRAPINAIQIVPSNPDFTIGLSPSSQTVVAGNSTTYTVTTTALNGFSGTVSLAASGLPSGATPSFSPMSIAAGSTSTLTVTTTAGEAASSGTFNVTGTSGNLTHSTMAGITVTAPDFTVSASPITTSVTPGGTATYTVTISALNGFTGSVALNASGLPGGASPSFTPASIAMSGNSTFTITTTGATPLGNATVTITGTSGSLSHSTTVTLYVANAAAPNDAISIDFVGLGTPMGNSETAGVVAATNWNNASGASSSAPLALVDHTGAMTNASVTWSSDDVWDQTITDQPGNVRMMKGYLDNGQQNTTTVTVTGLPSDPNGFTVYVYADGSTSGSNTGIYQVSGTGITTTSATLTYNANFTGTFAQATPSNPIGNYVILTIPNVSGFTLSAIPSTSTSGYERAPLNGMQIVPK